MSEIHQIDTAGMFLFIGMVATLGVVIGWLSAGMLFGQSEPEVKRAGWEDHPNMKRLRAFCELGETNPSEVNRLRYEFIQKHGREPQVVTIPGGLFLGLKMRMDESAKKVRVD